MTIKSHTKASQGAYFFNLKRSVGPLILIGCLFLFSSFRTPAGSSLSANKDTKFPPDTMSGIDHELKELMLREFKMRQFKDSLIAYAKSFEGRPYRYGARGPKSFDCSGFVKYVYKHFNLDLNRTSRDQSKQGEEVSIEQLQKGDLLFFTGTNRKNRRVGHVAIVVSEPDEELRFIHAASHGGVKVGGLDNYFEPRLLLARRVIKADHIFHPQAN